MSEDLLSQQSWRDRIMSRTGGRSDVLVAICEAFLLEVPQLAQRLRQAVQDQNAADLKRASHTLKSCLSYVAVKEDVRAAEDIEDNSDRPESITEEQLKEIDTIAQRWIECVQTLRDETAAALEQDS